MAMDYVAIMENDDPEIWPGSTPWRDDAGSFGTLPDARGFGSAMHRVRVKPDTLESFWDWVLKAYGSHLPYVSVSPRETPGLETWLERHGYTQGEREALLVRDVFSEDRDWFPDRVQMVTDLKVLASVYALDQVVFDDPIPTLQEMEAELVRMTYGLRRLFAVPGNPAPVVLAAGGLSRFSEWAYLWGGETHPDHRGKGLYGDLIKARVAMAAQWGVSFVAVHANEETSCPILLRHGFQIVEWRHSYHPPVPSA